MKSMNPRVSIKHDDSKVLSFKLDLFTLQRERERDAGEKNLINLISSDIFRPDAENFKMCLPYYLMSGLSISDIVHQAVIYKQQSKKVY